MTQSHYPRARKRFGQNFLHDEAIIEGILEVISPDKGQHLVEIGPGRGALTMPLLSRCDQLDVIELDRDLVPLLASKLGHHKHLTIHEADALKFDYRQLQQHGEKLRVLGNLPYNITTPLLFHLVEQKACIEDMCFMLQREVVERICAEPSTKQYGRLSIMLQHQCYVEQMFVVPPEAFDPPPKVESAIIYLQPLSQNKGGEVDLARLNQIVTAAFSQRRKTIANTLKKQVSLETLEQVGIEPGQRPETVTVEQYVELTRCLQLREAT
ncbi:16S rRNA (adenine(1518)-N(6)/adenine(1519)-N(6))-dimethyltransferase RsmA [Methylophaga sp.]|uniref:16S rRNA (adenine(1518)-N(6)/adenine(1519)-N(6))- dimethyltransferase RsmA n=1 Tax=Methylophaga sp. TaxID=2024840 RepID=UPI0013FFE250|nr:16S rRNA (adenine(1518)-N(6)/adenine(1519)-N(6))-dimethyltransferase RsmA [Methylophaga sp.]MTI62356.1 16S rRNA (adenine(1518)-N(6)/adenine(1519)-N(6))-dimethyltransferase RsmA [Methylophaga sp.]